MSLFMTPGKSNLGTEHDSSLDYTMSLYAECLELSLDWDSTEDIVYGCVDHVSKVKEAEVQRLEAEIEGLQKRLLEFIDLDIANRKLIANLANALETTKELGTSREDWKALVEKLVQLADALEDTLPMKEYASEFKLPYYELLEKAREAAK